MKKTMISLILVMIMLFISSSVLAFGLKLPGKKKVSDSAVSLDDTIKEQGDLVKIYEKALKLDQDANFMLVEAIKGKEKADQYREQAKGVTSGNCNSDYIKKKVKITKEAHEESAKCSAKVGELSTESKEKVGESMILMAESVICYKQAATKSKTCLDNAKSVVKSAPMTKKLSVKKKLDPVLTIGPKMPGSLVEAGKTLKNLVAFAKSNKIKVPQKATQALGEL